MRIVIVGAVSSIHVVRWANVLVANGHDVWLLSKHKLNHELDGRVQLRTYNSTSWLGYFSMAPWLRKQVAEIMPDIVNVHYASGYGTAAMLANIGNYCLSVYGSDVYDFPEKSFLHRFLVINNLKSATSILSTSKAMAQKVEEIFSHSSVLVTPFGVDEKLFSPSIKTKREKSEFIFGTVKGLEHKYGIDILIRAFSAAWYELGCPENMFLEIYGDGDDITLLKTLAIELGVRRQITFGGFIKHSHVPSIINRMDVFCALSRYESFGLAILEANSCEKPVIVSDAEGPVEVVDHGISGLIVPKEDWKASSKAMKLLYENGLLRETMGKAGRKIVLDRYSCSLCLDIMIEAFRRTIAR